MTTMKVKLKIILAANPVLLAVTAAEGLFHLNIYWCIVNLHKLGSVISVSRDLGNSVRYRDVKTNVQ